MRRRAAAPEGLEAGEEDGPKSAVATDGDRVPAGAAVNSVVGPDGSAEEVDPERRALEDERDFCLRSLRDLEAEWEAGDIDPADYRELKDSYTTRTAVVLRQLSGELPGNGAAGEPGTGDFGGVDLGRAGADVVGADLVGAATSEHLDADGSGADDDSLGEVSSRRIGRRRRTRGTDGDAPARGRNPWTKWVLIGLGVVLVAGGVGWAVAASSGTRLPGEEITGQALGPEAATQSLQAAEQAVSKGDDVTALKDFQKVLTSYPNQPEALTGAGWILAQTQQPALLQEGLTMLSSAEKADPTYAPAHLYRGVTLLSEDNYAGAIPELRWYLAHNPDPQLKAKVQSALQTAVTKQAQAQKTSGGG